MSMHQIEKTKHAYQAPRSSPGELVWMSVHELIVSDKYQRILSGPLAKRIASDWHWDFIKPLTVALRSKGWYIVDGQHTHAAALLRGDIDMLPVYIIATIDEIKSEAAAFLGANSLRSQVSALQKYHSGLLAQDQNLISIDKVIRECGFTVAVPSARNPAEYRILAISSVIALVRFGGLERLRQVLTFISLAWSGDTRSAEQTVFDGVAMLLHRTRDLNIDINTMASKIGAHGIEEFYSRFREVRATFSGNSKRVPAAIALAKLFDKNSRKIKISSTVYMANDNDSD